MASIELIKGSDGSGNASVATVQNTRSSGASTIIVDTVLGINPVGFTGSMGTPHTFTDPITSEVITVISEATAVDFTGHIDGSNIEIDDIAPGYVDLGSEVGDIVIIRPTTQYADNLAEVLEESLDDDGSIKAPVVGSVNIQKFTATGTYTPTAGMLYCQIEAVGGGGAGGGSNGATSEVVVGAGGGSGGYSRSIKTATDIGASKAVTIGAGGTPSSASAGGNGSDTSVGSLVIGKGGTGGGVGLGQVGGAGGVAGTGDAVVTGNSGSAGNLQGASLLFAAKGGDGGVSFFGGGATTPFTLTTASGVDGKTGSGGSGGASYNTGSDTAGGAGGAGYVLITEYVRI